MVSFLIGFQWNLGFHKVPYWGHSYLFCSYIDDIRSVVKTSSLKLYVDDVSLYVQVSSYNDCLKLQNDLSHVYNWSI